MTSKLVVFTRQHPLPLDLLNRVVEEGYSVEELPLISLAIRPCLPIATADLPDYDWVFFTSAAAVRFFYQGIGSIPTNLKIATIGSKTFEALKVGDQKRASYPGVFTSESFVASWLSECVGSQKVLLPQSELSRKVIQEELVAHHHQVTAFVLYDNLFLREQQSALENWLKKRKEGAVLVFASPSAWVHFYDCYQNSPFLLRFASIGDVTTSAIKKDGYDVLFEAPVCTMDSLIDEIIKD